MGLYGFFLLKGAALMSDGSELLLEVLDPGLIGGTPIVSLFQLFL